MLDHCCLCDNLTGGTKRPLGLTVRRIRTPKTQVMFRDLAEVYYRRICQPCLDEIVKAALLPLEKRQEGV